jgi:hypothetical protein
MGAGESPSTPSGRPRSWDRHEFCQPAAPLTQNYLFAMAHGVDELRQIVPGFPDPDFHAFMAATLCSYVGFRDRRQDRRRYLIERALPALIRFAKIRYAPGTPAGNSRNQEYAVKIYAPFP